jgi:hypothetical protein
LIIPEAYTIYSPSESVNETFLLDDSGPGLDRILIFGRLSSLDILERSKIWFCDGSFKIAPPLIAQVYVILAKDIGGVHPLIYALFPNKQAKIYQQLFHRLKQLKPSLCPDFISCDFENAAIISMKDNFQNAQINGCLYHLTKNFRLKLCSLGLISNYNNNADFALSVKMITALAFVKIEDIDKAVDELAEYLLDELQDLLDWFEENYIGRKNRSKNGRRPALSPPSLWNVHDRVINGQDRTNNYAEAANRK